jgi:hypothetical protein
MNGRLTQAPGTARLAGAFTETVTQANEVTESGMPHSLKHDGVGRGALAAAAMAAAIGAAGCTPTIQLAADKPITINLNVKIDQEIRYKIDRDLEDAIAANPDLF